MDASQGDRPQISIRWLDVNQTLRLLDVVEAVWVRNGTLGFGHVVLCGCGWDYRGYDTATGFGQGIGVIDDCVTGRFLGVGERQAAAHRDF